VCWVVQLNLLGCFLIVVLVSALSGLGELLGQPNAFYRTNGYILLAGILALLAWPTLGWLGRQSAAD